MNKVIKLVLIFLVLETQAQIQSNDTYELETHKKSAVLSRKKRFLIFPEGSSFQLGKCLCYTTYVLRHIIQKILFVSTV